MNSSSAPYSSAIFLISRSSVETTYLVNREHFLASSIVHLISSFPATIRRFFRGTPTEPPRAIVIPRTLCPADCEYRSDSGVSVLNSGEGVVVKFDMDEVSLQCRHQFVCCEFSFVLRFCASQ